MFASWGRFVYRYRWATLAGSGVLLAISIAGLLMGEIVSLTTFFAPKLAELIIFIVMAIVLLVRPSGLFGEAGLAE